MDLFEWKFVKMIEDLNQLMGAGYDLDNADLMKLVENINNIINRYNR